MRASNRRRFTPSWRWANEPRKRTRKRRQQPAGTAGRWRFARSRRRRRPGEGKQFMKMSDVLRQLRQEQTKFVGARPRLIDRFEAFLPVNDDTPRLTLGEGFTPLVHAKTLGRAMGCPLLFLKLEGNNPTGSFKDRGMV